MVSFQTIGDMSSNTYKPIVIMSSTFSCLCSPTIVKSIYTESKKNKDRVVLREWGSGELPGSLPARFFCQPSPTPVPGDGASRRSLSVLFKAAPATLLMLIMQKPIMYSFLSKNV